jgi:hypothetical protein
MKLFILILMGIISSVSALLISLQQGNTITAWAFVSIFIACILMAIVWDIEESKKWTVIIHLNNGKEIKCNMNEKAKTAPRMLDKDEIVALSQVKKITIFKAG